MRFVRFDYVYRTIKCSVEWDARAMIIMRTAATFCIVSSAHATTKTKSNSSRTTATTITGDPWSLRCVKMRQKQFSVLLFAAGLFFLLFFFGLVEYYLPLVLAVVRLWALVLVVVDIDAVCCASSWLLSVFAGCIMYQLMSQLLQLQHKNLSSLSGRVLNFWFITSIIFGPPCGSWIFTANAVWQPQMKHTFVSCCSSLSIIDALPIVSPGKYRLQLSNDIFSINMQYFGAFFFSIFHKSSICFLLSNWLL